MQKNSLSPVRNWIPTVVTLKCNVDVKDRRLWKGTAYNVLKLNEDNSVDVRVDGIHRLVKLKRVQYDITSRKRVQNEQP